MMINHQSRRICFSSSFSFFNELVEDTSGDFSNGGEESEQEYDIKITNQALKQIR